METNLLHPVATATSQLSWDGPTRTYTGEISSTNGFGRVYNDAIDEGMTLINRKTGREVVVVVDHILYSDDGELLSWDLKPAKASDPQFMVILFND